LHLLIESKMYVHHMRPALVGRLLEEHRLPEIADYGQMLAEVYIDAVREQEPYKRVRHKPVVEPLDKQLYVFSSSNIAGNGRVTSKKAFYQIIKITHLLSKSRTAGSIFFSHSQRFRTSEEFPYFRHSQRF